MENIPNLMLINSYLMEILKMEKKMEKEKNMILKDFYHLMENI